VRWLIVGPYVPEQGSGAAAAAEFAAERLAAGDTVHAVSPLPSAAHEHVSLEGLAGIRAVWRLARVEQADGLWLRIESGILLRRTLDRRRALMERAALALLLRRFDTSVLDVGDVGLLPGGRAGRPVLAAATRFVVRAPKDAEALVANGAAAERIKQVGSGDTAERAVPVDGPEPDYPAPTALHDLTGPRAAIEAAVRARAAELRTARGHADPAGGGSAVSGARLDAQTSREDDVAPGVTVVRTLAEADAMLEHFATAFEVSDDEARRAFRQYHMATDLQLPDDPFSDAYRDAVLHWYEWLHGRPYMPDNEVTEFDVEEALRVPFPYLTRSTSTVGQHLMILGNTIRSLDLPAGARVLEFGPGWGNIADALGRMGNDVTVIDIEPKFLDLINRRAEQSGASVTTILGDFDAVDEVDDEFDAVLFFECFHHCLDHVALLRKLDRVIKPGGRIYLAAEPVNDALPHPWGLRLDGESLWAIRQNGWLELGFQEWYLLEALRRTGWTGRRISYDEMPFASVYVAERIS
jgi:ubiquinone/menaquinone biosynthesis C-methylase UbiE